MELKYFPSYYVPDLANALNQILPLTSQGNQDY